MRIEEPAVDTANDADVAEQQAELTDSATDDAPVGSTPRSDLPLEADPADVAEQDAAVPYDDEEER
jgi:hypothetical protein